METLIAGAACLYIAGRLVPAAQNKWQRLLVWGEQERLKMQAEAAKAETEATVRDARQRMEAKAEGRDIRDEWF